MTGKSISSSVVSPTVLKLEPFISGLHTTHDYNSTPKNLHNTLLDNEAVLLSISMSVNYIWHIT